MITMTSIISTVKKDKSMSDQLEEASTYLGSKGYTIFKECLDTKELNTIRKDLEVKAFTPPNSMSKPTPFRIYRETKTKIFVPRFYGLNNYGDPDLNLLKPGEDIHLNFIGDLREFQKPIVKKYLDAAAAKGAGLLEIHCGAGKTVMALNIIAAINKKTLVIVHKEFLLNQWVERIEQFLPDAKIGRIQGPVIDIEGKDIVIGMLQSLSMKDYPLSIFQDFGFTVIDEVHHIGAEVFGRALFKIVTHKMLGLSATMERKDRLSYVFKMFLGDIVYSKRRESNQLVEVRAIFYKHSDPAYSETEYNFRGQTNYSKMIGKLCKFNRRSEFIIKVVRQLLLESDQQIMILAHNKNLLKYLHDAIGHRKIASVGYYIGGMKEADRKESETKQVIIATYAMAEEALDIKTLATLVMATPKTNVEQSIGRILRMPHDKAIVVDIVDQHPVFMRQWGKRKPFYRREKYRLISTDSHHYDKHFDPLLSKYGGNSIGVGEEGEEGAVCAEYFGVTAGGSDTANWNLLLDEKGFKAINYNDKKNRFAGLATGGSWASDYVASRCLV